MYKTFLILLCVEIYINNDKDFAKICGKKNPINFLIFLAFKRAKV
jgi:hypothetical protein